MAPESEHKGERPKQLPETSLKTLFVDNLLMSTRQDGMHLIQFYVSLPDGWSEQTRIMVADSHLKAMLTVLTERCASWSSDEGEPSAET